MLPKPTIKDIPEVSVMPAGTKLSLAINDFTPTFAEETSGTTILGLTNPIENARYTQLQVATTQNFSDILYSKKFDYTTQIEYTAPEESATLYVRVRHGLVGDEWTPWSDVIVLKVDATRVVATPSVYLLPDITIETPVVEKVS